MMAGSDAYDVAVIGGGINGAGIALDAALRGYSVILLEKDDIAAHTSGASTRLIHGGLRYLEYFELSLVHESLREREHLLHNAPHLVWPLRLHIPVYQNARRGPFMIRTGLFFYDLLARPNSLPRHEFFTGTDCRQHDPVIRHDGLKAVAAYYDAQAGYPERLCLELVLAAAAHGARILTRHKVTGLEIKQRRIHALEVETDDGRRVSIRARQIVNATGAYVDILEKKLKTAPPRKIGATKGTHIVLEYFPNGPAHAIYTEAEQDGRPFFTIPWEGYYLVGTTDTYYDDDPDGVRPEEREVDYLLFELNRLFPGRNFSRKDVLHAYAGLRPLPYEPGIPPARVTRRHIIHDHKKEGLENLLTIVGGKLTTYRHLAEQCVDLLGKRLNRFEPCRTGLYKLPGALSPEEAARRVRHDVQTRNIPEKVVHRLYHLYGARINEIWTLTDREPALARIISERPVVMAAQVALAMEKEWARSLEDIMLRRLGMQAAPDLGAGVVEAVSEVAASIAGWDENLRQKAVTDYLRTIREKYLIRN